MTSGRCGLPLAAVLAAVVRRPDLWLVALRQWRRTVPARWWRRPPFLPLPPPEYVRFRILTQYGADEHTVVADDVVDYLTWCKGWR